MSHTITYGHLNAEVPSNWKEVPERIFILFGRLMANKTPLAHAQLLILYHSLPFKFQWLFTHNLRNWRGKVVLPKLDVEDATWMRQTLSFVQDDPAFPWVKLRSIRNRWRKKFYGPADALANVTVEEFFTAERYFQKYLQHFERTDLDKLCATLYRKRSTLSRKDALAKGDLREEFNSHLVEYNARAMRTVPDSMKLAVLYNFKAVRGFFVKQFPEVFAPGGGQTKPYASQSFIISIARHRHQQPEVIAKQQIMTFLIDVQSNVHEIEEINSR